jgi:pimeloyl-ACP methyl ester carboxylesterase
MPFITTGDKTKLYVKSWGEGRPVILLHGWPVSADSWDDHAMAIAEAGFIAIAYDRRGFGRSDQPWSGYDYDALADDLAAVIQETGSIDATVVGFSMGGGEIARYMSRHGGKNIAQAALIASVVPYMLKTDDNPDGTDKAVFDDMAQQIKDDRGKFFTGFFNDFYGVGFVTQPVSDEIIRWSWNVAMQAGLKPTLECAKSFSTTDFRPDLAAFKVPTLIIHGDADKTVPIDATGRAAARGIAKSTLVEYDGGPHGLLASHKERIKSDLIKFLLQGEKTLASSVSR